MAIVDVGWLNRNSQRAYPFVDDASMLDMSGTAKIPDDFIVDMTWSVPVGMGPDPALFYLHSIAVFSTGVLINFGYNGGAYAGVIVATVTISNIGFERYNSYRVVGVGDFGASNGAITISSLTTIQNTMTGAFEFDPEATPLVARVLVPTLSGLERIIVKDASGNIKGTFTGTVVFKSGRNIFLDVSQSLLTGDFNITINCTGDATFLQNCVCSTNSSLADPIRTINGIPADTNGNFAFTGSSCLTITSGANGLNFNDVCSEPCCGCSELEVITTDLAMVQTRVATLEQLAANLNTAIGVLNNVILVSKTAHYCEPSE